MHESPRISQKEVPQRGSAKQVYRNFFCVCDIHYNGFKLFRTLMKQIKVKKLTITAGAWSRIDQITGRIRIHSKELKSIQASSTAHVTNHLARNHYDLLEGDNKDHDYDSHKQEHDAENDAALLLGLLSFDQLLDSLIY